MHSLGVSKVCRYTTPIPFFSVRVQFHHLTQTIMCCIIVKSVFKQMVVGEDC